MIHFLLTECETIDKTSIFLSLPGDHKYTLEEITSFNNILNYHLLTSPRVGKHNYKISSMFSPDQGVYVVSSIFDNGSHKISILSLFKTKELPNSYLCHILFQQIKDISQKMEDKIFSIFSNDNSSQNVTSSFVSSLQQAYDEIEDISHLSFSLFPFPTIKPPEIDSFSKLLTYHFTHQMHVSLTDMRAFSFLQRFLLPYQKEFSHSKSHALNRQLFIQLIHKKDKEPSDYLESPISPMCKDIVLEITSLPTTEQKEHYAQQKLDELIKLSASFIALLNEKLNTTGSDSLDFNQIDELCLALKLKDHMDMRILLEIARLQSHTIYYNFFKKWKKAIEKLPF